MVGEEIAAVARPIQEVQLPCVRLRNRNRLAGREVEELDGARLGFQVDLPKGQSLPIRRPEGGPDGKPRHTGSHLLHLARREVSHKHSVTLGIRYAAAVRRWGHGTRI